MDAPLVSLIVPTYNRAHYLKEALASACVQTYPSIEIIVLDDDSTDATSEVVAGFNDERIRYMKQPTNVGPNANWHAGIEQAKGTYFGFLADDDVLEPTYVERLVAPLERHEDLILAFCDHWIIDAEGERLLGTTEDNEEAYGRNRLTEGYVPDLAQTALIEEGIYIGAVLFRSKWISASFLAPEARSAMGGWILYQCAQTGKQGYYIPERLMNCRWQEGSVSRSQRWMMSITKGNIARFRKMLDDSDLEAYHGTIKDHLAEMLARQGGIYLIEGERQKARASIQEALELRSSVKEWGGLVLTLLGPLGTIIARVLRKVRHEG